MTRPVVVVDSSILGVLLDVPGVTPGALDGTLYDRSTIEGELAAAREQSADLILPLAVVIEVGNHIMYAGSGRYEAAQRLATLIEHAANGTDQWTVFSRQQDFWQPDRLRALAKAFPEEAKKGRKKGEPAGLSLADLSIVEIARYYAALRRPVTVLTTDQGLKAQEPQPAPPLPSRRR